MTLGEKIKHSRENKGLSQEQLAGLMKTSKMTVQMWETNLYIPDNKTITE